MKKLLIALALLIGTSATAQEKDVTKFLGIPVDGFKSEMIEKLKEKGFVPTYSDYLTGEFNGTNVDLVPVTNNNKVYRIAVFDKNYLEETDIKIRFNKLCNQFENNPRYKKISVDNFQISESEKISYNITVNKKRYEASYYQVSENGTPCFYKNVWFMIDDKYGQYRIIMFYDNLLNQANGEDL
ncbi:MAG: hypothetical protein E7143_02455 [Rikenellaceae bacterium]|nr:hypothetical protein [Rikenellaceae bacterium]